MCLVHPSKWTLRHCTSGSHGSREAGAGVQQWWTCGDHHRWHNWICMLPSSWGSWFSGLTPQSFKHLNHSLRISPLLWRKYIPVRWSLPGWETLGGITSRQTSVWRSLERSYIFTSTICSQKMTTHQRTIKYSSWFPSLHDTCRSALHSSSFSRTWSSVNNSKFKVFVIIRHFGCRDPCVSTRRCAWSASWNCPSHRHRSQDRDLNLKMRKQVFFWIYAPRTCAESR